MDASLDSLSISRNPTRTEHHSVDMPVIRVSLEVALVVWTDVFDAAFRIEGNVGSRYSTPPQGWRCTGFSSALAVPSKPETNLGFRTDHIPG